ncbi:MAG: ABC transporter substrate-binding protein [Propionibacteriaceae bacterium]|jgi:multiple sugar transport system substrate-binding protein|nr:ABC transporter substrate-binding protein [Propionibacteriaceae bacterium]
MTHLLKKASVLAVTALAASMALAGCTGGGNTGGTSNDGTRPVEETGQVTLKFMWWGNETRNKLTQEVLDKFQAQYPNIKVETETSDFASYFAKVSTSIAAGQAPDVLQMDEKFIATYGLDDNLMDLESIGIDLSKFDQGSIDAGRVDGKLYGATFGINVPVILANPAVFAKAGVDMPDDTKWTWDDYATIASEIGAKGGSDYYGSTSLIGVDGPLKVWLREHGKQQFTTEGIGFEGADVAPYYQYWLDLQTATGTPPATVSVEEGTKALNEGLFATNRVALTFQWSNQVKALDAASGQDIALLRPPTTTGKAADANLWLKSSMYLSIGKDTKHADAALKLVEFFINNTEAGAILGTERGISPNSEVRDAVKASLDASDKKVVDFIDKVTPELGGASLVPLPGGGQSEAIQKKYGEAVLLGTDTPATAADNFVKELKVEMELK